MWFYVMLWDLISVCQPLPVSCHALLRNEHAIHLHVRPSHFLHQPTLCYISRASLILSFFLMNVALSIKHWPEFFCSCLKILGCIDLHNLQ